MTRKKQTPEIHIDIDSHNLKSNPKPRTRLQAIEAEMNKASQRPRKTKAGTMTRKPSTRLKARRAKSKHDGYFPNPTQVDGYYVVTTDGLVKVPGKAYIVAFPINMEMPILAKEMFHVHKALTGGGWVVTHDGTGFIVDRGDTRKEAIAKSLQTILRVGQEKFMRAIERAQASFQYQQAMRGK